MNQRGESEIATMFGVTRLDTGEIVQERPMTDGEKQLALKPVKEEKPPAAEPAPPF